MKHEIVLSPDAAEHLRALGARDRSQIRTALESHLRYEPTKTSKSRIKRLRGMLQPQYRLRVDELRVFYDVTDNRVEVLAIVDKSKADEWLQAEGEFE